MSEQAVSASEIRKHFSDYLQNVDRGRVLVTKHGKGIAYLVSARELRALEETVAILENEDLKESLARGLEDLKHGRVEDAHKIFDELDAQFGAEDK